MRALLCLPSPPAWTRMSRAPVPELLEFAGIRQPDSQFSEQEGAVFKPLSAQNDLGCTFVRNTPTESERDQPGS